MIISIEGMDGSGKTTVGKKMATKIGYQFLDRPLEKFWNLEPKTYEDMGNKLWSFKNEIYAALFYGMGCLLTRNENNNIILDRHIVSTYFWNGCETTNSLFDILVEYGVQEDLSIILYADLETRMNRIKKRSLLTRGKDRDLDNKEVHLYGYDKMIEFVERYGTPYVIINTNNLCLEEVIEKCINIFSNIKELRPEDILKYCNNYNRIHNEDLLNEIRDKILYNNQGYTKKLYPNIFKKIERGNENVRS